jgi:hypothetical protein
MNHQMSTFPLAYLEMLVFTSEMENLEGYSICFVVINVVIVLKAISQSNAILVNLGSIKHTEPHRAPTEPQLTDPHIPLPRSIPS